VSAQPLVSVVTPAYNAEPFLAECIESVQAQKYGHFEHIIVDNGSKDRTREIAERYARADGRIRVLSNPLTLPVVENWNATIRHIADASRFCQTLHADDWLYPDCLARMVELGMRNPSVGVIGSLRRRGTAIQCTGLPTDQQVFAGTQVARLFLKEEVFAFAPTSGMVRSDIVRARDPFYPTDYLHADLAAYFDVLHATNFGFVHEVLAFSRTHEASITSTIAERKRTLLKEWPMLLTVYGPKYFNARELAEIERRFMRRYHRVLVREAASGAGREFLAFHLNGLRRLGRAPRIPDYAIAAFSEFAVALASPGKVTRHLRKLLRP
jgi:glycosyltransferase involved in cell wall biosynthesis